MELQGKKVLVRACEAGVYFGTLKEKNSNEVELINARNIWYWSGAASLLQMANEGVKNPHECKFSQTVESITILNVCAIIPCTDDAVKNLESVSVWQRR